MSLLSSLRARWRRHDESLAERAARERYDHESEVVSVPIEPYGVEGPIVSLSETGETLLADAVRDEDALEHEEPR